MNHKESVGFGQLAGKEGKVGVPSHCGRGTPAFLV